MLGSLAQRNYSKCRVSRPVAPEPEYDVIEDLIASARANLDPTGIYDPDDIQEFLREKLAKLMTTTAPPVRLIHSRGSRRITGY
jgi:hypothetical protein